MYRLPPFRIESVFTALSETVDWGLTAYHVPEHWKDTRGGGIKVAVLDTGIDESHPDLVAGIDDARDFTRSRFGPIDQNGHGTHTAGIIGARQNNIGVIGVAPECRLLVGKVLGDDGAGSAEIVAAGIDWACDCGADVISMSLGSPQPDSTLLAAISRAAGKGKFLLAAAGNDGRPNSVNYPARWRDTIAVAAVDRDGSIAPFSSQGPEVDVAANPLGHYQVVESRLAYRRILASGVASTDAKKWWFMGDFRKAFAYMENWPITVTQSPPGSEADFNSDIVVRFKASERGAAAVINPRYIVKNTG